MPFDERFDEVFEYGITPAVENKGYHCIRMDEVIGSINIIHEIIHNIYEADLIIADLTGKNANVFYELGVAHSVAQTNNTIMIAEKDEKIPFDIVPYKVLKYVHSVKGILTLSKAIADQIDFFEKKGNSTTNPVLDYRTRKNKQLSKKDFPGHLRQQPADKIFNQLNNSLARLSILSLLNGLHQQSSGLRIRDICQMLSIQKRKIAVMALREMENDGLIKKVKQHKSAFWRISESGKEMLRKLEEVIQIRIEPYEKQ